MNDETLQAQLSELHRKLDHILELLEKQSQPRSRPGRAATREKPQPLTEEEIKEQQERFQQLFNRWMSGAELEVQTELESADAESLRRFADANNLNITAKTPKSKALILIAARFREKRQLMQGLTGRRADA